MDYHIDRHSRLDADIIIWVTNECNLFLLVT